MGIGESAPGVQYCRITSYNVCYTKLLRICHHDAGSGEAAGIGNGQGIGQRIAGRDGSRGTDGFDQR